MKSLAIFIILALPLCLGSCTPKLAPDSGWENQRWVLTEMKGVPVQLSGTRRDAYLEFATNERQFSGNAGCNRINGNYTIEKNNHLKFGEVASTKMSCNDISFENTFLSLLNTVNRFERAGNVIYMRHDKEVILKFESRPVSRG